MTNATKITLPIRPRTRSVFPMVLALAFAVGAMIAALVKNWGAI